MKNRTLEEIITSHIEDLYLTAKDWFDENKVGTDGFYARCNVEGFDLELTVKEHKDE